MSKDLPDVPGKEALIETVVFSPGEVVPAHRHNADVFAYVLDGSIVTQLKGGKPQIVHTGEVFYESPTDIHIASGNASKTRPAKLLVFFVKKAGARSTVSVANTVTKTRDRSASTTVERRTAKQDRGNRVYDRRY